MNGESAPNKTLASAGDVIVFPELPTKGAALHDMLARLSWYLAPSLDRADARVILFSDSPLPETIQAPAYVDRATEREYAALRARAIILPANFAEAVEGRAAVVFCTRKDQMREAAHLASRLGLPHAICVDPGTERYESSKYLRFGSANGTLPPQLIEAYRARFAQLKAACNGLPVGIFGTGPTLETVDPTAFSDSFNIATNSMVMNDALLEQLRPRVIVASDPIFHAGCSSYAGAFRAKLIEQVKRYDAFFVFPARDYHIYERHLSDIRDRLIGVPMLALQDLASVRQAKIDGPPDRFAESGRLRPINDAMTEHFYSFVTNNVMTFFLLPIAASISKSAIAAGFDGRNAEASTYFWDHAPSSQIGDKMTDIKECHPAFFEIDYNEYLSIHTDRLTAQLHYLERHGFAFRSITPSHVPVLAAHYRPWIRRAAGRTAAPPKRAPKVSIIMPNRDGAEYIARAIDSIVAQDFGDWELLIIDNLSSDASPAIAHQYALLDPRIRVLSNPKPGVSASRNMGLDAATGHYISFLDSDDELWARSLSSRVDVLERGASIAFGLTEFINAKGDVLGQTTGARNDVGYEQFIEGNPVHISSVMGRSSVLRAIRFDETLTNGEDYLYFATLARMGYSYRTTGVRAGCYRIHRASVTHRNLHTHNVGLQRVQNWIAADMAWHPYFDRRNARAADPAVLAAKRVQRDLQGLLHSLLAGSIEQVREFLHTIEVAIAADGQGGEYAKAKLDVKVETMERWAVRALAIPNGSKPLYRASLERGEIAFNEVILPWAAATDVRGRFAERLSAYLRRCSKEALGSGDAYEKKLGYLGVVPHDPAPGVKPVDATVRMVSTSPPPPPPVSLDLLSPVVASRWTFLNEGASGFRGGALNVRRSGGAYGAYATFAFIDTQPQVYDAVLKISELEGSLDLRMGGRMVLQIKSPGEFRLRLTGSHTEPLLLMPSNKQHAFATIIRFTLDPVLGRIARTG